MHLLVSRKMTTCSQSCGVGYSYGLAATLRVISGKWKPQVLYFLLDGPKRYGELKRTIQGVSDKVLIQQLKELEADRVLARTDYKEVPPRVDYALTPLGETLREALGQLVIWADVHLPEIEAAQAVYDGRSEEPDCPQQAAG